MAEMDVVTLINAIPSLIEQLSNALFELASHEDAGIDKAQIKEIHEYFKQLEGTTVDKYFELDIREKTFSEQESYAHMLVRSREAEVSAAEQDLIERIQKLKDSAFSAIVGARENCKLTLFEPIDDWDSEESQVSSPLGDSYVFHTGSEVSIPHETGENAGIFKPRPELVLICQKMDAKELLNFIMVNHKSVASICKEVASALQCVAEPGRLVLASLEGFYSSDESNEHEERNINIIRSMRHSCLVCIKATATLLAQADPGSEYSILYPEIKQQAKTIADQWKPKVANAAIGSPSEKSLEIEAFLHLLATFKIASEFDEEELCKLVLAVAHKRQAPELCRSLGLAHKISDVIIALIKSGKRIDAAHFIHAFQLGESFPIVPLLKGHLKDLRRSLQGKGGNSGDGENNANIQELAALEAIIRCVKEYNLEAMYPLDPLQRRLSQLGVAKNDRKRLAESDRARHPKKQHANGVYGFRGSNPTAYDFQAPSSTPYSQQAYDQSSYYYTADQSVASASHTASSMSTYEGYTGNTVQGTEHQPYE